MKGDKDMCKYCRAEELLLEHWRSLGLNPDEMESLSDSEQEAWVKRAEEEYDAGH